MKKDRPKLKLQLTTSDKVIEWKGWGVLLLTWVLLFVYYPSLSDEIPIHYNAKGEIDAWGSKTHFLMLPIISTLLLVGLTTLNKFPHVFNYPVTITERNALKQYTNATRLIRYLKLVISVVFAVILLQTSRSAKGEIDGLGSWFLPLFLLSVFSVLIYAVVKSFRS